MPQRTMSLGAIVGSSLTASNVLCQRDRLHVVRSDTLPSSAQVINLKAGRNLAHIHLIGEAVS